VLEKFEKTRRVAARALEGRRSSRSQTGHHMMFALKDRISRRHRGTEKNANESGTLFVSDCLGSACRRETISVSSRPSSRVARHAMALRNRHRPGLPPDSSNARPVSAERLLVSSSPPEAMPSSNLRSRAKINSFPASRRRLPNGIREVENASNSGSGDRPSPSVRR
jgi:hypothetical protein